MMFQGFAFFLAALYWALTAFYGVMASQAFIQEQFLAPRLFPPLALFADGSVRFLKASLDMRMFARLATRAGGEVATDQ